MTLRQAQVEQSEERLANDPTSELWGEHRARYRFAAAYVSGTVLDVACGSGFGLEMLALGGSAPIGLDYDADALRTIRYAAPSLKLACADAARLPLPTASIDTIVSFETIEHVPDAEAMVLELRRVLKPRGSLVLSTPNRAFGPPELHTSNRFHIREFTADELRDLLCRHFSSVTLFGQLPSRQYRYVPFLMVNPDRSLSALAWKALARLPFRVKDRIAFALSGRPFYPGETDYRFERETRGAHALVAVAQ